MERWLWPGEPRPASAADADAGAVVASRSDDRPRGHNCPPGGDHRAVRTGAAGPVDAPRTDDGVRFNGERREKQNRPQRRVENCFHGMCPLEFCDAPMSTRALTTPQALDDDTAPFTVFADVRFDRSIFFGVRLEPGGGAHFASCRVPSFYGLLLSTLARISSRASGRLASRPHRSRFLAAPPP